MTTMMQQSPGAAAAAPASNTFVPAELFNLLGNLSRGDADACDFGVVKVDDAGKIELYNRYEADLAGLEPSQVEGRNFFTQVAPCTNNGLCFGTFKKGVAAGQLNVVFPYTFTYKLKPTNVMIHLYRDQNSKTNWVFVAKA
jgi:photoactive yellow protein